MSRRNLSWGTNIHNIIKVIIIFALSHHVLIRYFIIMSLPCNFHHTAQCRFCYMFFVKHCAAHAYVFIPIVWYYVIFLRWKRLYASFFIVSLYTYCRWIPSYQEGSWDHINWLTPQPFNTEAIDFQHHISWSPMFVSVSWSERLLFLLLIIVECLT